jgi:Rad52/22 family double-strand break repair protein
MSTSFPEIWNALAAPFAKEQVKTRPGSRGMQLQYITARTAMNRLDEVLGPENWEDEFGETKDGLSCRITVTLPDGRRVTKMDGGGFADMPQEDDTEKSAFSDAFKRAAVKFGVGRYLYHDGVPTHHAINYPNQTGHGSGAYAPPDQVKEYCDWVGQMCDIVNARWLDYLTDKKTGEISGKAPAEIVNYWQLSGHLLKFAKANKMVNAPDEQRAGQRDKLAAVAYHRFREAIETEAVKYCRELWKVARARYKALQIREPGSDDDLTEDEAMDKVATEHAAKF